MGTAIIQAIPIPEIHHGENMTIDRLREITARVLGIKPEMVKDSLSRDRLEEWDSFNHLLLVSEIEKELKVSLTIQEVERIKTFKALRIAVMGKSGRQG